ncbi:alpha-tocopherol transfer protein-like isoform X2 [Cylas formicarius]|uniref:alpha-tocopherol transfer protein-like isoform X2 n=1 Tax=Cylas formicarius TaxID=197179 RepID=UPI0029588FDA|nr:alpha-tocopherol transfer protein-like isoform X2 [Cylas formicarius]
MCKKSVGSLLEPPTDSQTYNIALTINETSEDKLLHNEKLLYEWIESQKHFPKNIDKAFLRAFLRGSKHHLVKAKRKIEHHLSARYLFPEVYANRSPFTKDIIQAMDVVNMMYVPKLTDDGCRVAFFKLERCDPSEFHMLSQIKLFFMLYEVIILRCYPACGDVAVFDAKKFGAAHLTKFTGPVFRTLDTLLRNAYAIRVKQIHVINAPPMIGRVLALIKPIMHHKVRNSVFVHKDPKDLLGILGADVTPCDYGGNLKSVRSIASDCYDFLADNADWLEAQENVKITGIPKKVERSFYFRDELGLEGSFRKLEID